MVEMLEMLEKLIGKGSDNLTRNMPAGFWGQHDSSH
jgi:hypothetical protein